MPVCGWYFSFLKSVLVVVRAAGAVIVGYRHELPFRTDDEIRRGGRHIST